MQHDPTRKRVLLVFGTRPEAIKMAPVHRALRATPGLDVRVAVTAQHREMLDQVLRLFDIRPQHDLGLMQPGQSLGAFTGAALGGLDRVLSEDRPHLVMVHGDTATTLSAALAAFSRQIPLAHVEAGLRTGTLAAPWPEEMNRRLTSTLARLHFAPTETAAENLRREQVPRSAIVVTGNTVIDALLEVVARLERDAALTAALDHAFGLDPARRLILVTCHRRESFGPGIARICTALAAIARRADVQIVFPLHPNPGVRGPVTQRLGGDSRISLIPPQDYLPFVHLMRRAHLILTDSGGIQEEAPALGKPVLVLRDTTERPEAVSAGTVSLVGTQPDAIIRATHRLLDDPAAHAGMARAINPYGDGHSAARIRDAVLDFFQISQVGQPCQARL
jgi:UDP-N-acetylglucosamine 2-epimerase (non-hydrolysing)